MSRRYYGKYRRNSGNYNKGNLSPIEMLLEMLLELSILLAQLVFKIGCKIGDLIIDRFHQTRIDIKTPPNLELETQPIPEVDFEEQEEEKEVYLPYRKKSFLLTRAEYAFDKVLREAVQDTYYIGRQVPLSSIVEVTTTSKPYRSKIDKKTIDFVLFNKAGYTPYLAIELDDRTHLRPDRIMRDEFVQNVLKKAGIRLERIKNTYSYDKEEIAKIIN